MVNRLAVLMPDSERIRELEAEVERLQDIIQPNEPGLCCANRHSDVWTGEVCLTCPDRSRRAFDA